MLKLNTLAYIHIDGDLVLPDASSGRRFIKNTLHFFRNCTRSQLKRPAFVIS